MLRPCGMSSTAEDPELELPDLACTLPTMAIRPAWDMVGDDAGNPRPLWWPALQAFLEDPPEPAV